MAAALDIAAKRRAANARIRMAGKAAGYGREPPRLLTLMWNGFFHKRMATSSHMGKSQESIRTKTSSSRQQLGQHKLREGMA
jgi:hypothetical protein